MAAIFVELGFFIIFLRFVYPAIQFLSFGVRGWLFEEFSFLDQRKVKEKSHNMGHDNITNPASHQHDTDDGEYSSDEYSSDEYSSEEFSSDEYSSEESSLDESCSDEYSSEESSSDENSSQRIISDEIRSIEADLEQNWPKFSGNKKNGAENRTGETLGSMKGLNPRLNPANAMNINKDEVIRRETNSEREKSELSFPAFDLVLYIAGIYLVDEFVCRVITIFSLLVCVLACMFCLRPYFPAIYTALQKFRNENRFEIPNALPYFCKALKMLMISGSVLCALGMSFAFVAFSLVFAGLMLCMCFACVAFTLMIVVAPWYAVLMLFLNCVAN